MAFSPLFLLHSLGQKHLCDDFDLLHHGLGHRDSLQHTVHPPRAPLRGVHVSAINERVPASCSSLASVCEGSP